MGIIRVPFEEVGLEKRVRRSSKTDYYIVRITFNFLHVLVVVQVQLAETLEEKMGKCYLRWASRLLSLQYKLLPPSVCGK